MAMATVRELSGAATAEWNLRFPDLSMSGDPYLASRERYLEISMRYLEIYRVMWLKQ